MKFEEKISAENASSLMSLHQFTVKFIPLRIHCIFKIINLRGNLFYKHYIAYIILLPSCTIGNQQSNYKYKTKSQAIQKLSTCNY